MKIYVNSANSEFEIDLNDNLENRILVNDNEYQYDLLELGGRRYSLLLNNKSYTLHHIRNETNHHLQVDNNHFILAVEDEHQRKIKKLFKNVTAVPQIQIIKAPIPGLVIKIIAQEGCVVEAGAPLLILEAMKMENIIKATCACRVNEIAVKEKQTVEINQPLLKLVKESE